jgi:hypothetical protein
MNYKSNLAFVDDTLYNSKNKELYITKQDIPNAEMDQLLISVKRILILRENILASGMELSELEKVSSILHRH